MNIRQVKKIQGPLVGLLERSAGCRTTYYMNGIHTGRFSAFSFELPGKQLLVVIELIPEGPGEFAAVIHHLAGNGFDDFVPVWNQFADKQGWTTEAYAVRLGVVKMMERHGYSRCGLMMRRGVQSG